MINHRIEIKRWLIDYFILTVAVALYGLNIYCITSIDSTPPKWDEAVHLRDSFVFYNIISEPSQVNLQVIKEIINKSDHYPLIRPSGYYPPLAPVITSFLYFIFGVSAEVAVMCNLIFLIVLIFSVYKIGTLMFSKNIGLLASVTLLLFPIILQHSIIYYLDLPLTAASALGIYSLLKTDYFNNTKFSIIAGFCFGFGMLVKWTFLFFILGPLIYSIIKSFFQNSTENESGTFSVSKKSLRNIILFSVISIITCGIYYFPILSELLKETFKYSHGPITQGPDSILSLDSMVFYIKSLWNDMVTPVGIVFFSVGMILLYFTKNNFKVFLFIWIILPYIIFTFVIQIKASRFMMPWVVPISVIISFCINLFAGFFNEKLKLRRYVIIFSLLLFSIFFFNEITLSRDLIVKNSKEDWGINEVVKVLEEDMINNKKIEESRRRPIYFGSISDHPFINSQTIRYYTTLKKLPINIIKLQDYSNNAFEKFVRQFDRYDYILTKSHSNIALKSFFESSDRMNNYFISRIDNFKCLKTIIVFDGSLVSIFKRNKSEDY